MLRPAPGPAVLGLLHTPKINPSPFCLHGPESFGSPVKDPVRSKPESCPPGGPSLQARHPPSTGSLPQTGSSLLPGTEGDPATPLAFLSVSQLLSGFVPHCFQEQQGPHSSRSCFSGRFLPPFPPVVIPNLLSAAASHQLPFPSGRGPSGKVQSASGLPSPRHAWSPRLLAPIGYVEGT